MTLDTQHLSAYLPTRCNKNIAVFIWSHPGVSVTFIIIDHFLMYLILNLTKFHVADLLLLPLAKVIYILKAQQLKDELVQTTMRYGLKNVMVWYTESESPLSQPLPLTHWRIPYKIFVIIFSFHYSLWVIFSRKSDVSLPFSTNKQQPYLL